MFNEWKKKKCSAAAEKVQFFETLPNIWGNVDYDIKEL